MSAADHSVLAESTLIHLTPRRIDVTALVVKATEWWQFRMANSISETVPHPNTASTVWCDWHVWHWRGLLLPWIICIDSVWASKNCHIFESDLRPGWSFVTLQVARASHPTLIALYKDSECKPGNLIRVLINLLPRFTPNLLELWIDFWSAFESNSVGTFPFWPATFIDGLELSLPPQKWSCYDVFFF